MELQQSRSALRALARLPAFGAVQRIADSLAWSARRSGQLLVVGTPSYEPWHLVAHLQTSATLAQAAPTLVRWAVPVGAPAHLAVGLDQLSQAGRADTVLVVADGQAGHELLERLDDARRRGNTVLALASQQAAGSVPDSLDGTSHELAQVSHDLAVVRGAHFDHAQHYLPVARPSRTGRR
ncbi:MAG TPA: hypothetical protein VJ851_06395 [Jatrophihabitans sp.]|nr:hypothetical protein [Jatrophihabitans sp.]